jgi:predicted outer membrane repeat protein
LSGNVTDRNGGGIFNAGTATVSTSTLSSNSASYDGGGIYNGGTVTVTGCTLSSNSALDGGGIYNAGPASALTVSNSVFSGNSAPTAQNGPNIFGPYTDGGGNTFN